jgi:hypothetical protein
LAEAVGDQVGRAHDVDELGVEGPAAGGGEGLGFDEEAVGGAGSSGGERGEDGEREEKERTFHGRWVKRGRRREGEAGKFSRR